MLKENVNLELLSEEEGQALATAAGNTLPVDRSYCHLSGTSIQKKTGRRETYCSTNIKMYTLFRCRNCNLFKNKRARTDNITEKYKDELIKKSTSESY